MASARGEPGTWRWLGFWNGDDLDLAATRANLPADELNTARLIAGSIWPGMLHCVPGKIPVWYIWDGTCHEEDTSSRINREVIHGYARWCEDLLKSVRKAVEAEQQALGLAAGANTMVIRQNVRNVWERDWKAHAAFCARLRSNAGIGALRGVLGSEVGASENELDDAWPWRLNTLSGMVSLLPPGLRNELEPDAGGHELLAHDPRMMVTYCVEQPWVPDADCPQFRNLIWRAAGEDADVYSYLIKVLGYSALGANLKQNLIICAGDTNSGKSKMLQGIASVLGPGIAHKAQTNLIANKRDGRNAREEYSLRGMRLVTIAETSSRIHIDEAQIKRLTGEDTITVDKHYSTRLVRTGVSWLIIIATNKMPSILQFDDALKRRIIVIPMGPTIPPGLRDDTLLDRILREESAGILNLCVQGARLAMEPGGMEPPQVVKDATALYAAEQSTVENWLADHGDAEPAAMNGSRAGTPQSEAWSDYERWSGKAPHLGRNEFYEALEQVDGVERKGRTFYGFVLRYGVQDWTGKT